MRVGLCCLLSWVVAIMTEGYALGYLFPRVVMGGV